MNRLEKKFKDLGRLKKKAFIAFITAGYPNLLTTKKLVLALSELDVDIIELGVPFSDPMADGPVIQEASQVALKNKVNLKRILDLVRQLRKKTEIPITLMTYYNPIFCFGESKFVKAAVRCGVDGVIIPDLPPEEANSLRRLANEKHLDIICFISPTTSRTRIKYIASISKGFIYYVSLTGVTGIRQRLPADLIAHVKVIREITAKPVCVGFGISRPEQVKQIYKIADGVIIGSAIVREIKENIGKKDLIKRVSSFITRLKNV